ncbi:MAG: ABC transporter permease [Candidatus Woesearchaeota archaeon]
MKIAKIIQKNLKLLMRSKGSIITTLIGPLVIIFLVGLAFGNISSYNINVGVYSTEYNDLTDSFISKLENQSFKVVKYPLEDICINEIKKGTIHTCIFFPDDFDIGGNKSSTIEFYVDETNVNIVSMVKEAVTKQVQSRMQELSEDLTAGILQKIDDVKESAKEQTRVVTDLIDESSRVKGEIDSIQTDVNDLDLNFDKDSLQIGNLDDSAEDARTNIRTLNTRADSAVDLGEDLIDDIRALDHSADIESLLDSAEDDLSDLKSNINTSYSTANDKINDVLAKLANLSSSVNDMNTRFNSADATKYGIRDDLSKVKNDLVSFGTELASLQDQINTMGGNVDNVEVKNAQGIVAPIKVVVKPVVAEKAPLHYMLPSLVVLVIMFISMMLAGTMVIMEKTSSAYFRNFVTPTVDVTFLYGIFFTNLIVVGLQMFLVLSASMGVFGASIMNNIVAISIVVVLSIAIYTIIGMIIGHLFTTQEMVSLGGISVGSLFLLMSNVIFPIEKMPDYLLKLADYNPFNISEYLLRQVLLFNTEIVYLMDDIFTLVLMIVVLFLILVLVQKLGKMVFLTGVHFFKHKKYSTIDKEKLEEIKNKGALADSGEDGKDKSEKVKPIDDQTDDPDNMESPDENTGFFRNLFKKTTHVFEEPKLLKDQIKEFEQEEFNEEDKGKSKSKKSKKSKSEKNDDADKNGKKVKDIISRITGKKGETNPLLAKLEPHQYFVLSSGNIVKSYKDLVDMLDSMDDDTFNYHVGKDKNDFYLWIKNVLKVDEIADKIEKVQDRKQMLKILKKYI